MKVTEFKDEFWADTENCRNFLEGKISIPHKTKNYFNTKETYKKVYDELVTSPRYLELNAIAGQILEAMPDFVLEYNSPVVTDKSERLIKFLKQRFGLTTTAAKFLKYCLIPRERLYQANQDRYNKHEKEKDKAKIKQKQLVFAQSPDIAQGLNIDDMKKAQQVGRNKDNENSIPIQNMMVTISYADNQHVEIKANNVDCMSRIFEKLK